MPNLAIFPGTGGTAFNPLSLSPVLYLTSDQGTSTTSDGTALSAWNDQSTSANNMIQATGGNQPTYKASGPNGQPYIRFSGSSQFLQVASFAGLSAVKGTSLFIVFTRQAAIANAGLFALGVAAANDYNSANGQLIYQGASGTSVHGYYNSNQTGDVATTLGTYAVAEQVLKLDGSSPIISTRLNGGTPSTNAATSNSSTSPTGAVLAARWTSGAAAVVYAQADVAAVLLYPSILTTGQLSSVRVFLGAKYGITVTP